MGCNVVLDAYHGEFNPNNKSVCLDDNYLKRRLRCLAENFKC